MIADVVACINMFILLVCSNCESMYAFYVFFGVCKCDVFVCFDVCVGVFLVVKCNFVGVLYAS